MRLRTLAGSRWTSKPSISMRPPVGGRKPVSMRMVVVLPAPLGPRKPTISRGATSKEMSFTAMWPANRLVRWETWIMDRRSVGPDLEAGGLGDEEGLAFEDGDELEVDEVAGFDVFKGDADLVEGGDFTVVDGGDEHGGFESGEFGGSAGEDFLDDHTAFESVEGHGSFLGGTGEDEAKPGAGEQVAGGLGKGVEAGGNLKEVILALDGEGDGGFGGNADEFAVEGEQVGYLFTIDGEDAVGGLKAGGSDVGIERGYEDAVGGVGEFEAEPLFVDDVGGQPAVEEVAGATDGHGEADVLGVLIDGDVESDHLAVNVEEGPSGVAGIDGGIGLEDVAVEDLAVVAGFAVFGGKNPDGDGVGEAEGIAEDDHGFAEVKVVVGGEGNGGEGVGAVDFNEGEVVDFVAGEYGAFVDGFVGEHDADAGGALDDMEVGEDVAVGMDDDAGAEGVLDLIAGGGWGTEEVPEEHVEEIAAEPKAGIGVDPADHAFGSDVDHGGHSGFHRLDNGGAAVR